MTIKMTSKVKHFYLRHHHHLSFVILYLTPILMSLSFITGMKIDPDGGYKDLVIRISSDGSVPENDCPKILYNLKVRLISNIVFIQNFENNYPNETINYTNNPQHINNILHKSSQVESDVVCNTPNIEFILVCCYLCITIT